MTWQLCHFSNGIWVRSGNSADIQLAVALLLNFSDHSLEGGAAADGGECLGGDTISNAFKALLHKCFTLRKQNIQPSMILALAVNVHVSIHSFMCNDES